MTHCDFYNEDGTDCQNLPEPMEDYCKSCLERIRFAQSITLEDELEVISKLGTTKQLNFAR